MLMVDLIKKKRNGETLTKEEIYWIIEGYTRGDIPDYQVSALMMAIYYKGLDKRETLDLTMAMKYSGDILDLSMISGIKVDKHSTGGVGDKTSLVLAPMVAATGVPVAKMSGRGLGHTGGTIDKLESFKGFRTDLSEEEFINAVNSIGIAIMGQTKDLAPADKKLYALRDVTGTVDNMSLIASSIMSKKLAAGCDGIVLDVTCGSGAFMKTVEDARALAQEMVSIGKLSEKRVTAVISDMDEPLGFAVGNTLEVIEAIDTLKGKGPADLLEVSKELGACMLILAGKSDNREEAKKMLDKTIEDGSALSKLAEFVKNQGSDEKYVYDTSLFDKASLKYELKAHRDGYVSEINCEEVGNASLLLGGGRRNKEDIIDHSVGIILNKKLTDRVSKGDVLATLYANDKHKLREGSERLKDAYVISSEPGKKNPLIIDVLGE
ncbi:MAG: pyrimidine-nucleoside phosphorylase [Lachnospiraceae bacterium]|nr:pyrimidine-nucleoside phosphorylase [Lachnospiraceae bacterium]